MKQAWAILLLLVPPAFCSAQDADLRSRAVSLLEKAHAVSLAPNLPNLERVDTFRAFDPSSAAKEGSFTRVVIQGVGRREEAAFGDYHVTNIWTGDTLATTRVLAVTPPEIDTVMRLTPIDLIRFDRSDVIRAISDRELDGQPVHCIAFDTIVGQSQQENEICLDTLNGTLISEKLGDEIIRNSGFFPFAGALLPSKITYSILGAGTKLEIFQTMTVLEDAAMNVLAAPPDAQTLHMCTTFRRAIGQSMPQPQPGIGARDYDVVVRGIIGTDGKVQSALVQSSERVDLNAEALSLIAQWTFSPALCNGRPNPNEASFLLRFHGR